MGRGIGWRHILLPVSAMSLRSMVRAGAIAAAAAFLLAPSVAAAQHRSAFERDLAETLYDMRARRAQNESLARMQASMREIGNNIGRSMRGSDARVSTTTSQTGTYQSAGPRRSTAEQAADEIASLRTAGARGDTAALIQLGNISATGWYTPKDMSAAFRWYSAAGERGSVYGQTWRGILLMQGDGVARDSAAGLAVLRRAAAAGSAQAREWVDAYDDTPPDAGSRFAYYRRAAERGDAHAMAWVGQMYEEGDGVAQSDSAATVWYQRAADGGSERGLRETASRYDEGRGGLAQDGARATALWRTLAERGDPVSILRLGYDCLHGRNGQPVDTAAAMRWFRRGADAGDGRAAYEVGTMYRVGSGAVPRDLVTARRWFERGEAAGFGPAANNVATEWLNGVGGPMDTVTAMRHLVHAAELGFAQAAGDLGYVYEGGLGSIAADRAQALRWYTRAALLDTDEAAFTRHRRKVAALGGDAGAVDAARAAAGTAKPARAKGTAADL